MKRGWKIGIIVIILVCLLVLSLIYYLWVNWDKITGYCCGVNVDTVRQACSYACSTQSINEYCCWRRNTNILNEQGKRIDYINKTCSEYVKLLNFENCTDIDCSIVRCQNE